MLVGTHNYIVLDYTSLETPWTPDWDILLPKTPVTPDTPDTPVSPTVPVLAGRSRYAGNT